MTCLSLLPGRSPMHDDPRTAALLLTGAARALRERPGDAGWHRAAGARHAVPGVAARGAALFIARRSATRRDRRLLRAGRSGRRADPEACTDIDRSSDRERHQWL